MAEPRRFPGVVEKVTLRRLKSGEVRHWTRIKFFPERDNHPFKGVSLTGTIRRGVVPELFLLLAIRDHYDVPQLNNVNWSGSRPRPQAPSVRGPDGQ